MVMDTLTMDLTKVVAKMTDVEGGVPRKDRKYLFKRYKQSFTGQELVSWLLSSSFAKSREEGVTFGQALMEQEYIFNMHGDAVFQDKKAYYCLNRERKMSAPQITKFQDPVVEKPKKVLNSSGELESNDYQIRVGRFASEELVTMSSSPVTISADSKRSSFSCDRTTLQTPRTHSDNNCVTFSSTSTSYSSSPFHSGSVEVQQSLTTLTLEGEEESGLDGKGRRRSMHEVVVPKLNLEKAKSARRSSAASIEGSDGRLLTQRELPAELDVIAKRMKDAAHGVPVKDRKHLLRKYPNSFTGRDAISWFVENSFSDSREEARKLGNSLMQRNVFAHISGEYMLEDRRLIYIFTEHVKFDKIVRDRHHSLVGSLDMCEKTPRSRTRSNTIDQSYSAKHQPVSRRTERKPSKDLMRSGSGSSLVAMAVGKEKCANMNHIGVDFFDEMVKWWTTIPYSTILSLLDLSGVKNVRTEAVTSILALLEKRESTVPFVQYSIKAELIQNDKFDVAFRCDSIYLLVISEALKMYSQEYFSRVVGDMLSKISVGKKDSNCEESCRKIISSVLSTRVPPMVLHILHTVASLSSNIFLCSPTEGAQMSVVALFFLRCLVPAIINPASVRIASSVVRENKLLLVKIAKEVQSFANSTLSHQTREKHKLWNEQSAGYWQFVEAVKNGVGGDSFTPSPILIMQDRIEESSLNLFNLLVLKCDSVRTSLEGAHLQDFEELLAACRARKIACMQEHASRNIFSTFHDPFHFESIMRWFGHERMYHRFNLVLYYESPSTDMAHTFNWLKQFSSLSDTLLRVDGCIIAVTQNEDGFDNALGELDCDIGFSLVTDPEQEMLQFLSEKAGSTPERVKGGAAVLLDSFAECIFKWIHAEDAPDALMEEGTARTLVELVEAAGEQ